MSFDDDARDTALVAADQVEPRLRSLARQLGPDELAVWLLVGERLTKGRVRYGELDLRQDRRCFVAETIEEVLDASIYSAAALVREVSR